MGATLTNFRAGQRKITGRFVVINRNSTEPSELNMRVERHSYLLNKCGNCF